MTARRLVVIGDTLLDSDIDGTMTRIAPDAPAPVLEETTTSQRPGGAGLAALLAAGQGYDVVLITALAQDAGAAQLTRLMSDAGITVYGLTGVSATAEKVRLRADGQVLLRLDRGGSGGTIPDAPPKAALDELSDAVAVLVSDYGRGVARQPALRAALTDSTAPVIWDPHPHGPAAVPGVRLVTPNETELRALTGSTANSPLAEVSRGAAELRRRWRADAVAVTLGAHGALLRQASPTPLVVPVPRPAGGDTCGAGDCFAAAATLALAGGAVVSEAVRTAVGRATGYVAAGGTAALLGALGTAGKRRDTAGNRRDNRRTDVGNGVVNGAVTSTGADRAEALAAAVRARGGTVVASGGCFDLLHAGHVATLEAARRLGDCLVVCVNSDASVRALKGRDRPLVDQADRVRLLAALSCVDAVVVFDEATPHAVLSWLRPDVWVKGGDYSGGADSQPDLPEAELVARWGGQTVVVPYLDGRSTTRMITAARSGGGGERGVEVR